MIFEKIRAILCEQFDTEEDEINLETDLKENLEADSLDLMELMSALEEEFKIEIDTEEDAEFLNSMVTVQDIVDYISTKCGADCTQNEVDSEV